MQMRFIRGEPLVHHARVGNKGAASWDTGSNLVGNEAAEVAGVVVEGNAAQRVLNHQVVDLIDTAFEGFYQSASANDGIEGQGNVGLSEFIEHQLTAHVLLFDDIVEGCQFLWRVYNVAEQYWRVVFVDGHLS